MLSSSVRSEADNKCYFESFPKWLDLLKIDVNKNMSLMFINTKYINKINKLYN